VIDVAVSLCRIYHWCKDAFPTSRLKNEWRGDVWREACEKTGANRDSFIQPELASLIPTKMVYILDLYRQFPDSSMKLFLETKKRIGDTVEVFYDFDPSRSSVSRNADLASALLHDMSFVYRVCRSSSHFVTH
jgi:hypothetical protein